MNRYWLQCLDDHASSLLLNDVSYTYERISPSTCEYTNLLMRLRHQGTFDDPWSHSWRIFAATNLYQLNWDQKILRNSCADCRHHHSHNIFSVLKPSSCSDMYLHTPSKVIHISYPLIFGASRTNILIFIG